MDCDFVVVSIFLNRQEFEDEESYSAFPKSDAEDIELLNSLGYVDVLFIPNEDEICHKGQLTGAVISYQDHLTEVFEGSSRTSHFSNICTMLMKFLGIIQPTHLIIGRNCIQTLRVVSSLLEDLRSAVKVISMPQKRNENGVGLNWILKLMGPEEKKSAAILFQSLQAIAHAYVKGDTNSASLAKQAEAVLQTEPKVSVDYVAIVQEDHFDQLECVNTNEGALAVAAITISDKFRLVDNIILGPTPPKIPLLKSCFRHQPKMPYDNTE